MKVTTTVAEVSLGTCYKSWLLFWNLSLICNANYSSAKSSILLHSVEDSLRHHQPISLVLIVCDSNTIIVYSCKLSKFTITICRCYSEKWDQKHLPKDQRPKDRGTEIAKGSPNSQRNHIVRFSECTKKGRSFSWERKGMVKGQHTSQVLFSMNMSKASIVN